MNPELEAIEALVPDFQYVEEETGNIVLTVGFAATFYFWGGHTPQKRQALVECFEAFEAAYGDELEWAFDPEHTRIVRLSDKKLRTLRDYVQTLDEDDAIQWYLSSGEDYEAVGDFAIGCLTERGWMDGDISYLTFHVPRSHIFIESHRGVLEQLILLCHEKLQPFHGNAGLTAITPRENDDWQADELDLATRYYGLFIENRINDSIPAPFGLKSINWLTFVSDVLSQRLGGPQAFVAYCRRFGVEPMRHGAGFIVRAGELPQLGPVTEPPPAEYVAVNAALRPLRYGGVISMGDGSFYGDLRFNPCRSDLWVRRFDAPGIWPPKSFVGMPEEPLGAKPLKRKTLRTLETCEKHGRYRRRNVEEPELVLLPGDTAPYYLKLGPHGELLGVNEVTWELAADL